MRLTMGVLTLSALLLFPRDARGQTTLTPDSIRALAHAVSSSGSAFDRTTTLLTWVNTTLKWSASDYVSRTPPEILARGEGNCADLAAVLRTLLTAVDIRSRWVRELNIHPVSDGRQTRAEQRIAQVGLGASVFGRQHNDHVWLEVWDPNAQAWFPADAAAGAIGMRDWLRSRLAFANRLRPPVDAAVPIVAQMLVPIAIVYGERRGTMEDVRSAHYLIDGFNRLYGGRLATLRAWLAWVESVHALEGHALNAFNAKENLHNVADVIGRVKSAYDALAAEATSAGIVPFSR